MWRGIVTSMRNGSVKRSGIDWPDGRKSVVAPDCRRFAYVVTEQGGTQRSSEGRYNFLPSRVLYISP